MERVLSWLNQPLFPDTVIRVWMAVAAGAALLLALILAFFLIRRKKKKKRGDQAVEEPITERPEPLPELELANLQGVGSREEQQDAFGISRMDRYEEDGLLRKRHPNWWGAFHGRITTMFPGGYTSAALECINNFAGTEEPLWWPPFWKKTDCLSGAWVTVTCFCSRKANSMK